MDDASANKEVRHTSAILHPTTCSPPPSPSGSTTISLSSTIIVSPPLPREKCAVDDHLKTATTSTTDSGASIVNDSSSIQPLLVAEPTLITASREIPLDESKEKEKPSLVPSSGKNEEQGEEDQPEPLPWKQCNVHRPTLAELKSQSFSNYIRTTVLKSARPKDCDDDDEFCHFDHGLAKVVLPRGFLSLQGIAKDQTARGPDWQRGTPLGDYVIPSPMHQYVQGLAGTYSYTLMDGPARTVAEYRDMADEYRQKLLRQKTTNDRTNKEIEEEKEREKKKMNTVGALERQFWKRLGPTMPPPMYGADQEGTLFHEDDAQTGWSLGHLDSCLHVLGHVPGVTSPYLYFGMWASVFCAHTEDMNLLSINYLHAGAPKFWYGISSAHAERFKTLAANCFCMERCGEFLRHKHSLISPQILQKTGIPFTFMVQYPGEAVVTFPGAYHFGFNAGFNIAEATNFGVPEWVPFGRQARVCLCQPDSVRIDMEQFCTLLAVHKASQKSRRRGARLSWKQWGERRLQEQSKLEEESEESEEEPETPKPKRKEKLSEQQRRNEFWVEVMKPVTRKSAAPNPGKQQSSKHKRKRPIETMETEIWHLAQPMIRKRLTVETRVLVIVPAMVMGNDKRKKPEDSDDEEDPLRVQDEQCFAGRVVEISQDHVRVHLDGLAKADDIWVPIKSPKLLIDGGRWSEEVTEGMPALHYWQEMDSKRRCTAK